MNLQKFFIALILTFLFSNYLFSQVNLEWERTYHGPANGGSVYKMVVDNAHNVVVSGKNISGTGFYDIVTIKYTPSGDSLWVRRFSNGNNDCDLNGLASDAAGNIYVTGTTSWSGQLSCILLKYDPTGNMLWQKVFSNAPDTRSIGVALDAEGNPYIGGVRNQANADGWGVIAVKFNPLNGDVVWSAAYDNTSGSTEIPYSVCTDASGNVYVCGYSQSDYIYSMLVKFSSAGTFSWASLYRITGVTGYLFGNAVKTDASGNIYLAGKCYNGQATFDDFLVMKYYPAGDTAWVRKYSASSSTDEAFDVAVDNFGNVYATGKSYAGGGGSNNYDYLTVKYSPEGNLLWQSLYDGPAIHTQDEAKAIVLDNYGNCYITGGSSISPLYYSGEFATVRYDQNGNQVWAVRHSSSDFGGTCIAFDSDINIYVGGSLIASYATLKYVQPPVPVELTSFSAVQEENSVKLQWSTATETNNAGFELQRKSAGEQFRAITYVEGNGTSSDMHNYYFYDRDAAEGKYTYRIKQIDLNGSYSFSNEIEVVMILPDEFSLYQNYPNPFNPSTIIRFNLPRASEITFTVYNSLGESVYRSASFMNAGMQEINFSGKDIRSGIYLYEVRTAEFSAVKKMVLLR